MSYSYRIYPEQELVVVRFFGLIDYQVYVDWIDEALADESFSKEYDGIVDVRTAYYEQVRPEKAHLLAAYMIECDFTHGSWAVLATAPAVTALSYLYSREAAEKHPIAIFSTIEGAAAFLARKQADIEPLLEE